MPGYKKITRAKPIQDRFTLRELANKTSPKKATSRKIVVPNKRTLRLRTRFQPRRECASRPPTFIHFFMLPAELRADIFERVLVDNGRAIDVDVIWNDQPEVCDDLRNLSLVSRRVRAEAADVFYRRNTFILMEHCDSFNTDGGHHSKHPGLGWLKKIGPANAASLRSLHLRMRDERPAFYYNRALHLIADRAPNITQLALIPECHANAAVVDRATGQPITPVAGVTVIRWDSSHVKNLSMQRFTNVMQGIIHGVRCDLVMEPRLKYLQTLVIAAGEKNFTNTFRLRFPHTRKLLRIKVIKGYAAARVKDWPSDLWDAKPYVDNTGSDEQD